LAYLHSGYACAALSHGPTLVAASTRLRRVLRDPKPGFVDRMIHGRAIKRGATLLSSEKAAGKLTRRR
jgi:hypothetical protein